MSERHFRRKFKQVFGKTPAQQVEIIRIDTAKQWLVSRMDTLEKIARAVGYRSPDAFRRAFERSTGVSPSEYRQRFSPINAVEHQSC